VVGFPTQYGSSHAGSPVVVDPPDDVPSVVVAVVVVVDVAVVVVVAVVVDVAVVVVVAVVESVVEDVVTDVDDAVSPVENPESDRFSVASSGQPVAARARTIHPRIRRQAISAGD
jgi:hypothetical protein